MFNTPAWRDDLSKPTLICGTSWAGGEAKAFYSCHTEYALCSLGAGKGQPEMLHTRVQLQCAVLGWYLRHGWHVCWDSSSVIILKMLKYCIWDQYLIQMGGKSLQSPSSSVFFSWATRRQGDVFKMIVWRREWNQSYLRPLKWLILVILKQFNLLQNHITYKSIYMSMCNLLWLNARYIFYLCDLKWNIFFKQLRRDSVLWWLIVYPLQNFSFEILWCLIFH